MASPTLRAHAAEHNAILLKLETGPFQPEALGLYERCGYERCDPFGPYADDSLSVFMQKRLSAQVVAV